MDDLIRKSAVINRLVFMRTETEMNRKGPATKRSAALNCIDEMIEQVYGIETVKDMEPVEVKPETEPEAETAESTEEEKPVKTFPKDKYLEPIMKGSQIGIDRYRCWRCRTIVDKADQFCKHCGSKFGEIVEHKNTQWDTTTNRPAGREVG